MNNNKKAYISKVHLKGYKSIRDLEIDFKPGLNVIIGPNGSGKTNFQAFTNDVM
jgi:recombinational DNA repair ATPase RecF